MADAGPSSTPDWPLFGWTDDVRGALAQARQGGRTVALATLHTVVGGSPRPPGSQMLVDGTELHGFLSGGCIEGDVAARSQEVIATGRPQRLVYGEGGPFADIRLVCGGRIELLLEAIAPDDTAVAELLDAAERRRPVLWASDGVQRICVPDKGAPPAQPASILSDALGALSAAPDVAVASVDGGAALALRRWPRLRLCVIGRDPVALAIARMASESGFETHLLRPKGPATPPPLPGVAYHRAGAGDALDALGLDAWTYVAAATHVLEEDEDALTRALPSEAAYVGVLGARRRLPERLARLRALGVPAAALERLHAPIGLDIGGKAPFEIAVAVLAEIIAEANHRRPSRAFATASPAAA
jgi:xanthine dehydrogenase accessory factor